MSDTSTSDSAVASPQPQSADFDVDGAARRCPNCGRPFRTDHLLALHRGEAHPERLSDEDRRAYEEASDEEDDRLFVFHLKVLAVITLVMFVFIYTYSFVWL